MKKSKRLSDILKEKPTKASLVKSIKDYRTALFIYSCYLQENYLAMGTQIKRYGEDIFFFRDFLNLLRVYYHTPLQRNNILTDLLGIYKAYGFIEII